MIMTEKMIIAMSLIRRHANDQSTLQIRPNRVIIVASVTIAVHRQIESIKNRHDDAVQVVAVTVAATHVTPIDHVINVRDVNAHRPTIEQVDRVKAATNVISIQEKKATLEVIAIKRVAIELLTLLHIDFSHFHELMCMVSRANVNWCCRVLYRMGQGFQM